MGLTSALAVYERAQSNSQAADQVVASSDASAGPLADTIR